MSASYLLLLRLAISNSVAQPFTHFDSLTKQYEYISWTDLQKLVIRIIGFILMKFNLFIVNRLNNHIEIIFSFSSFSYLAFKNIVQTYHTYLKYYYYSNLLQNNSDYPPAVFIKFINNFTWLSLFLLRLPMFVSLRSRASRTNLNSSDILNSSADQTRLESASSKRFSRKQLNSNQLIKTCKTLIPSEVSSKAGLQISSLHQQSKKPTQTVAYFTQNSELKLKLSNTPLKNKNYISLLSTDRVTQPSHPTEKTENNAKNHNMEMVFSQRNQLDHLQAEIDLKSAQIILLQDQNIRLKRELATKQSEFFNSKTKIQKEHQKIMESLKLQIQAVKQELQNKNQQILSLKKQSGGLARQLKTLKYDKAMLQKQLDDAYKRKLTKQLRDLMSYRQQSLQLQVEDLREQLRKQKTDKERQMEEQLDQLKFHNSQKFNAFKKFEIHSHVLNKKVVDIEEELKYREEHFSKCLNNIQQTNEALAMQLKRTKKQNVKLQRISLLSKHNKRFQDGSFSPQSNTLSLSLSSINSRL